MRLQHATTGVAALICRCKRETTVNRHTSPIDHRPFQPRAKLENQQALVDLYRAIGIQDVAEALHHLRPVKADRASAAAA